MDINALKTTTSEQDPEKWGPHTWATMHSFALRSDSLGQIDSFLTFLTTLETLIPCTTCRNDFAFYLSSSKPLAGRAFKWTIDFHNHVNKKIGKTTLNDEQAMTLWTSNSCQYTCTKKPKTGPHKSYAPHLALCLLVILVFLYIYKQWNPSQSLNFS